MSRAGTGKAAKPDGDEGMTGRGAPSGSKGRFIVFEGTDGVGKTTQIELLASHLRTRGADVVSLREPGGTEVSEKIRDILLDPANSRMGGMAELLLYEAARAQLVEQVIKPALQSGAIVLCDRFTSSTLAYQGYGRGVELDVIRRLNRLACAGVQPDVVLLLQAPAKTAFERATESGADRLEQAGMAFQDKVAKGFAELARDDSRIAVIEVTTREKTNAQILRELEARGLLA